MTVTWPSRGQALGGLEAKRYIDEIRDQLEFRIEQLTGGTGDMRNADNLAFLVDFAAARAFLDVANFAQMDQAIAIAVAGIVAGIVAGSGDVATDAVWQALGDLAVGTGPDTAAVLTVGPDGQVLAADSTEPTGLKWIPAGGGGGVQFTFTQDVGSTLWAIGHDLGAFPNVTTTDTLGRVTDMDIFYIDANNITAGSEVPSTGQAFLS